MNTLVKHMKAVLKLFPIFVAVLLSGCGGGGGGGPAPVAAVRITGTAAAGAPVVGYVSVRDSSANPQPVKTNIPIEATGNYSVDVTGLTAPYAFLASGTVGGKTVSLYSAATSADEGKTINITPFTDLIIRNIAATAVDTYLAGGGMSNLTTAELNAKRDALTTQLTPALLAMGVSGSIDLLRTTFNADNTGLDRFMDVVKVSTTSTTATITNILDAANTLTIDTSAGGTSTGTLGIANLSPTATPLDGILQTFNTFSSLFATSVPTDTDPNLTALFSSTFLDDGNDRPTFLTQITTKPNIKGLKFTNLVLDSIDATGTIAQIHFTPLDAAGISLASDKRGGSISWQVVKNAGVWQSDGNRRIAYVGVRTSAIKRACNPANTSCSMTPTYTTGLWLEIDNDAAQPIGSAVVTGPGLPGGVTLVQQIGNVWFYRTTINPNDPLCNGCTGNQQWIMSDADMAFVLPNSSYTVKLYDNATTPALMATYTEVVPVAPASTTAVAAMAYPSLSGLVNLAGIGATTLRPSWNIPAGLTGGSVNVDVYQNVQNVQTANLFVGGNNNAQTSSGTASLVITAPITGNLLWSNGSYWITVWDQYGGQVETNYQ